MTIKHLIALLVVPSALFLPARVFAATPPNAADYTVTIHVTSSQVLESCTQPGHDVACVSALHLDATIDGQKYQMQGNIRNDPRPAIQFGGGHSFTDGSGFLALGDYKAKLEQVDARAATAPYFVVKNYEILFPDGRTASFQVVGQTE